MTVCGAIVGKGWRTEPHLVLPVGQEKRLLPGCGRTYR